MKKRILIVEDEESLRLFYEEELKAEGYEVLTARNGREAIQQLEEIRPDLIILDIVMPVMDGMEALGRILRKDRKIPIILNTSYSGLSGGFYELGGRCLRDQIFGPDRAEREDPGTLEKVKR